MTDQLPASVQEVLDALNKIPRIKVVPDGPTVGKEWFIDIVRVLPQECGTVHIVVQMNETKPNQYGFSIIDEDTGYTHYPDCICGCLPALVKYVSRLLGQ